MEYHVPVLLKECIEGLTIQPNGIYVDATLGGGGHAREILKRLIDGQLVVFDRDREALEQLDDSAHIIKVHQNYRYLKRFLKLHQIAQVDGILADLGISSHQIDIPERGFSTRFDGPLDMRMDKTDSLTAEEVVNEYSFEDLKRIFSEYGEIRNSNQLAHQIIEARKQTRISTTKALVDVIQPISKERISKFLAQTFQAIRIEVNDELRSLEEFLEQSVDVLKPGGRLVILTYHSLEDRLVKRLMKTGNLKGEVQKDFFGNRLDKLKPINKRPIIATEQEIEENPRARSAKLRIAQKI